jgi:hypothetical protein
MLLLEHVKENASVVQEKAELPEHVRRNWTLRVLRSAHAKIN